MEHNAPEHVVRFCYRDKSDAFFLRLCEKYERQNSFLYKLKCTCDCKKFVVYKDAHPSVLAECSNCGKVITVYDLDHYPSAIKLKKDFVLNKVDENPVSVYVNYDYDDEFLYEEDVEFDANDITWAKVFIVNSRNELIRVLDDETA